VALILEQLDARRAHVVRRIPLVAGLTVGRALDRGLIVDDLHVDAAHAQVAQAEDGSLFLDDAGSVNGIDVPHAGRTARAALTAGAEFRLGRTWFRVADTSAPVPAALPLAVAPSGALPWYEKRSFQLLVPLVLALLTGLQTYFGTATRDAGSDSLALVIGLAVMIAIWAGIWALVGRGLVRRAAFLSHATIASGLFLYVFAAGWLFQWAQFLFPAFGETWDTTSSVLAGGLLVIATVHQLGLATSLSVQRRWVGTLAACGIIAVLVGAFALVADDAFSDVPKIQGIVRYAPAAMIPATDVEGFRGAITELRADVDSLKPREAATSGR